MRKKSKGDTWDGIFADPEVGIVLKRRRVIADANKSSIKELATITTLNPGGKYNTGYFYNNKVITKFPELKYCTGLSDLYGTFSSCSNLVEAPIIPDSVTNMRYTFDECTNLIEAPIIPEGVIDMEATFSNCSNLVEAPIIPDSVTNMSNTFRECAKLDDIFVIKPVTPPNLRSYNGIVYTFAKVKVVAIYVPDESVDSYKSHSDWRTHSSKIYPMSELPE